MDTLGLVSLIVGLASLVAGIVGVWYARDAAIVGHKALKLAEEQAASGPRLDVTPKETYAPILISCAAIRRVPTKVKLPGFLGIAASWPPEEKPDIADGYIVVKVTNVGNRAAQGVTGWIDLSPAFLRPLKRYSVSAMPGSWGVSVDDEIEDGSYRVTAWDDKITPGTCRTFEIAVKALAYGACAIEYQFVSDEGIDIAGRFNVHIVPAADED